MVQVMNGAAMRVHLCGKCARAKGFVDESGAPSEKVLHGDPDGSLFPPQNLMALACAGCGLTLPQLAERKLLGCGRCYETFGEVLEPILKQIQRDSTHRGRAPVAQLMAVVAAEPLAAPSLAVGVARRARRVADVARELEANLKLAVTEERYEDAAALRDRIFRLRSRKKMAGKGK
jgi:protein arginine kinase activator